MSQDKQNKTEKPTQKRLDKARKSGNFVSSRDLTTAIQFLVYISLAFAWFSGWMTSMKEMLRASLSAAFHSELTITNVPQIATALFQRAFIPVAIIGGLSALATLGVHLAMTRFGFSMKKLKVDINRLNPGPKIRDLFSNGFSNVLQASVMLVLFSITIYFVARRNAEVFLSLPFASLDTGLSAVGGALKDVLTKAVLLFMTFGIIDFARKKRKFAKDMRMSKQEIREEAKENESNPQVKAKLRRMMRDLIRRQMMKNIPTATAVIVNPTHYAVAVRYDHETMATPMVVAKGKNYLALRIRQIATDAGVPLVENPPLAQALYKHVEVGKEIPPHLYRAVAEVLAYIYRVTRSRR